MQRHTCQHVSRSIDFRENLDDIRESAIVSVSKMYQAALCFVTRQCNASMYHIMLSVRTRPMTNTMARLREFFVSLRVT